MNQKEGGKIVEKMSKDGKNRMLQQRIFHQEKLLPDKVYVIVVFDIPEDTRMTRSRLRLQLKKFGFEPYQLSVWVSQKDVAEDMEKYLRLIGAHHWVHVFQGCLIGS